MWRTSNGERTLHSAEAKLFAETLLSLLDRAHTDQLYDYDLGLPCFDNLSYGQKVSVLSTFGNGLLREDVPVIPWDQPSPLSVNIACTTAILSWFDIPNLPKPYPMVASVIRHGDRTLV